MPHYHIPERLRPLLNGLNRALSLTVTLLRHTNAKQRFVITFFAITFVLAIVRLACPGITNQHKDDPLAKANSIQAGTDSTAVKAEDLTAEAGNTTAATDSLPAAKETNKAGSRFFDAKGNEVKNRIFSVPHFGNTFPDENDVQLLAAQRHGVKPVKNRTDAEARKQELVYIGSNPYFHVDPLKNSIPYLVPRASVLLQDIGRAFYDSLQIKGIPLHQIIVTSVLRSEEDIEKLSRRNQNAKTNSCHLYATTFDICYNRYKTVETSKEQRRAVRNDSLKWVLSEVLRDIREQDRALIKYEVKQGCFHITVK